MSDIDPMIAADFAGSTPPPAAPQAHIDPMIAADFATTAQGASNEPDMADKYGSEAGPGYLLTNPDFWRGAARGAVQGVLSATADNPKAGKAEVAAWTQRLGLDKGANTPEGMAGQVIGGFGAPVPGGPEGKVAMPAEQFGARTLSAAQAAPSLANASPELAAAAQKITDAGGTINPEVLARRLEAESLPIPAKLSKGQATQDPVIISREMNQRGTGTGQAAREYAAQNQNMIDNLQEMRDRVGPDVYTTNQTQHGQTLIDAYKAKDEAANTAISQKYQALKVAAGGQFPVDAKTLLSNVTDALHQELQFEHAPTAEMKQLNDMATKGMTLEQFEAMRTNLARTMRSSADGNERAAAGIIRDQMEKLPMTAQTAQVKALADDARAAAKARFDAIRGDPAYAAVVKGKASPDSFVDKFIVGGDSGNVAAMRKSLADNQAALQTMSVGALDNLRAAARVESGNFTQNGYNKSLQALGPKISSLFTAEDRNALQSIGNVARYQQFQPRGSFVNNSNTTVSALAEHGKSAAASLAEGAVNAKLPGVGTFGRVGVNSILKGRAARKFAEEHFSPGAGLDYVSPTP